MRLNSEQNETVEKETEQNETEQNETVEKEPEQKEIEQKFHEKILKNGWVITSLWGLGIDYAHVANWDMGDLVLFLRLFDHIIHSYVGIELIFMKKV